MNDDMELLRGFADEGSQEAFAELVRRKVNLVFAAALRQTGGDAHLAQDVTQGVFIVLAANAARLKRHAALSGWLFTTTRYLAIRAVRRQQRWQRREQEGNAMTMENKSTEAGVEWANLRPVIDEALHELAAKDRDAILLRFFEGQSFGEIGAAIGLAENAARMRVERAMDKLRGGLARRGIGSTTAALGVALAHQPAVAVPVGLAASAASAGLASVAVGGSGAAVSALWALNFMNATKLTVGVCAVMAVLGVGAWLGMAYHSRGHEGRAGTAVRAAGDAGEEAWRAENRRLREELEAARAGTKAAGGGVVATTAGAEARAGEGYGALRTLVDVRRRKLANLEFEFFGDEAKLEPAFVELFEVSQSERAALQAAVDGARQKLDALLLENTNVSRTPKGDVAIAIKPFPEAGGAVYDAMLKTFADTLGSERYTAFLALGAEQAEKKLGRFGTAQRTIQLSREISGGEVRYRINDHSRWSERDNSNYSDHLTPERLAREMGPLVEMLPADFLPRR